MTFGSKISSDAQVERTPVASVLVPAEQNFKRTENSRLKFTWNEEADLPFDVGVVGVNFKTAKIEAREQLAKTITIRSLEEIKRNLDSSIQSDSEFVALSTCNRIEVYFSSRDSEVLQSKISQIFRKTGFVSGNARSSDYGVYDFRNGAAVKHLFHVASGLDSLVIGEAQILTQIRNALRVASSKNLCGLVLQKLFLKAYSTGKEVRETHSTLTNGFGNSVSLCVAQLISEYFKESQRKPSVLLVGSGKMAKLAISSLDHLAKSRIIVATKRGALKEMNADRVVHISEIPQVLVEEKINAIIVATTTPDGYVLSPRLFDSYSKNSSEPLLIADISVPRCVDPAVGTMSEDITLMNIDDLKDRLISPENTPLMLKKDLAEVTSLIDMRAEEFVSWLQGDSRITPIMNSLRRKVEEIRAEEVRNASSRLNRLNDEELEIINKMSERIIRRLLHDPQTRISDALRRGQSRKSIEYSLVLKELFSLNDKDDGSLTLLEKIED